MINFFKLQSLKQTDMYRMQTTFFLAFFFHNDIVGDVVVNLAGDSKIYATLGVQCKCCDSERGECKNEWTEGLCSEP